MKRRKDEFWDREAEIPLQHDDVTPSFDYINSSLDLDNGVVTIHIFSHHLTPDLLK